MKIDLGVLHSNATEIEPFCSMAQSLGFSGIAALKPYDTPTISFEKLRLYKRTDIRGRTIGSIRKQIDGQRKNALILSFEIGAIESTNWAIEDKRIDLLTLSFSVDHSLYNGVSSRSKRDSSRGPDCTTSSHIGVQ